MKYERRHKICSKLTIKTSEQRHLRPSSVFIGNFEHIFTPFFSFAIVDFKQVNVRWVVLLTRTFH